MRTVKKVYKVARQSLHQDSFEEEYEGNVQIKDCQCKRFC